MYEAAPRRSNPRIGGKIRANFRIMIALLKCFVMYLV